MFGNVIWKWDLEMGLWKWDLEMGFGNGIWKWDLEMGFGNGTSVPSNKKELGLKSQFRRMVGLKSHFRKKGKKKG